MSVKEKVSSEFPIQPLAHPTLADVAAIAGVSIKTASRVMNGSEQVSGETAERVKKAAIDQTESLVNFESAH
jgi:LacI family transcriptional regulator